MKQGTLLIIIIGEHIENKKYQHIRVHSLPSYQKFVTLFKLPGTHSLRFWLIGGTNMFIMNLCNLRFQVLIMLENSSFGLLCLLQLSMKLIYFFFHRQNLQVQAMVFLSEIDFRWSRWALDIFPFSYPFIFVNVFLDETLQTQTRKLNVDYFEAFYLWRIIILTTLTIITSSAVLSFGKLSEFRIFSLENGSHLYRAHSLNTFKKLLIDYNLSNTTSYFVDIQEDIDKVP